MERDIEALWEKFKDELHGYIKTKIRNEHDAEDLLQDIFMKIYKNIDRINKPSSVRSWIYTITRNTIKDYYKKRKDMIISSEELEKGYMEKESYEEENMNDDIARCLESMMFDLPEKYRKVYELHEKRGMKHREITEELNISISSSRVTLKRAKDLFKRKLHDCCYMETDKYGNIISCKSKKNCKEDCGRC